jgi:hypothetical protein
MHSEKYTQKIVIVSPLLSVLGRKFYDKIEREAKAVLIFWTEAHHKRGFYL